MAGNAERMQWIFDLVDKYTGNADRMTKSTDAFIASLERAQKAASKFEGNTQKAAKAGNSFAGWSGPLGVITGLLKGAGELAFSLAEGFGEAAYEASKFIVETVAFKESTLTSFALMLGGDKGRASNLFKDVTKYSGLTGGGEGMFESFQHIVGAGFNESEAKVLQQAIGDVASVSGNRATGAEQNLTLVLSHLRNMPQVNAREVRQLANWSSAMGVGIGPILEAYDQVTGQDKGTAIKMFEKGAKNLDSQALIEAWVKAVANKEGGSVGNVQIGQASTTGGLMKRVQNAPFNLIAGMDLENGPGMRAFKGFMDNLLKLFDAGSKEGQRFAALIDKVFNGTFATLFGDLSGPDGAKRMTDFFDKVITGAERLAKVLERIAPSMRAIGAVIDKLDKWTTPLGTEKGVRNFSSMTDQLSQYRPVPGGKQFLPIDEWNKLYANTDYGRNFLSNVDNTSSVETAETHAKALGEAITASPVFKSIGDSVSNPNARRPVQVTVHINVDASRAGDPAGIVQALREMLPAELEHLFQSLATETGSG